MADTFLVIGTGPTVNLVLGTDQTTNIVLSGAGPVYTAGTGIAISGANVISNTAPDQTVTMTDGTGIDVTGTYPNFTVTNTSPNVVQTLSIAGQDLALSGGGGTVAIPAGDNIYTVDGTISDPVRTIDLDGNRITFIGGEFIYKYENFGGITTDLTLTGNGGNFSTADAVSKQASDFTFTTLQIAFSHQNPDREIMQLMMNDSGGFFEDGTTAQLGLQYAAYYPNIETSPQSFADVQTVNSLKQKLATYTETERDAISSPATGYVIFCTDATATDSSTGVMQVYNGSTWKNAW